MAWSLYRWVWRLESPLYVGMAPAGMLNRTRLYVPARTVWAALTAEIARSKSTYFPDYQKIGVQLKQEIRLSYLYPAEQVDDQWKAWLPCYEEGEGLVWKREDGVKPQEHWEFRTRLLSTRPGTAIVPQSDTAQDGSLRESELVGPYWRGDWGARPVGLVGYVFVQSGNAVAKEPHYCWNPITLWCGGDTRYGLGRMRRVECKEATNLFGCQVGLDEAHPVVQDCNRVLAHVPDSSIQMKGEYELLVGWDGEKLESGADIYWQPGTVATQALRWKILDNGYWQADKQ